MSNIVSETALINTNIFNRNGELTSFHVLHFLAPCAMHQSLDNLQRFNHAKFNIYLKVALVTDKFAKIPF